jgi:hypothetical protein
MAEGRKVATGVYVEGTYYAAGSTPTPEHAALITNPKVWGDNAETATVDASADTPAEGELSETDTADETADPDAAKAAPAVKKATRGKAR